MSHPKAPSTYWAYVLLITISCIWGSSYVLIKKGLVVFSPLAIGTFRIFSGGLILAPLAIPRLFTLSYAAIAVLFVLGVIGWLVPSLCFAIAKVHLDCGMLGILNTLTPLFVLGLGVVFFGKTVALREFIGVVISIIGTLVILVTNAQIDHLGAINGYTLCVFGACLCYSINMNVVKYHLGHLSAVTIASVSLFLAGLLAGGILFTQTLFINQLQTAPGAYTALRYVLLLGTLSSALAVLLFNRLIQLTSTAFASTVTLLMPIVALFWGVLEGETLLLGHYAGVTIILLGVHFINQGKKAC